MFTYQVSTGILTGNNGVIGTGYSGAAGVGKNNPAEEGVKDVGPIPEGKYTIQGPPFDTPAHGPFVMRLIPDPANDMKGRSGFLMHGDSLRMPGTASEGCVIMAFPIREAVWLSGDRDLTVIA